MILEQGQGHAFDTGPRGVSVHHPIFKGKTNLQIQFFHCHLTIREIFSPFQN
jgi:hypothetical protein